MSKCLWLSLSLAACFGAAPPPPTKIPLPPVVPGTQITVNSESKTEIENVPKKSVTCPQGHIEGSPACITTRWSEREPVTRTTSTMTYGDAPIDSAQFDVLTDPEYDKKIAQLERLSERCGGARKYALIGFGLLVAGPLTFAEGAALENKLVENIGLGVIAAGFASFAYGYWAKGGNRCDEANALYREVEHGHGIGVMTVSGRAEELRQLADQFNEKMKVAR